MDTVKTYRSQELRKGRHSIQGAYYHVTTVTYKRKPILANDATASIIIGAFNWLKKKTVLDGFVL